MQPLDPKKALEFSRKKVEEYSPWESKKTVGELLFYFANFSKEMSQDEITSLVENWPSSNIIIVREATSWSQKSPWVIKDECKGRFSIRITKRQ